MTVLRKFNVNNFVRIKPTERGREAWDKWYTDLGLEPRPMKLDQDGWLRIQAWEAFQRFGDAMGNGMRVPFETEIQIEFEE